MGIVSIEYCVTNYNTKTFDHKWGKNAILASMIFTWCKTKNKQSSILFPPDLKNISFRNSFFLHFFPSLYNCQQNGGYHQGVGGVLFRSSPKAQVIHKRPSHSQLSLLILKSKCLVKSHIAYYYTTRKISSANMDF